MTKCEFDGFSGTQLFFSFFVIASLFSSLRAPPELASLNFSFASFLLFQDEETASGRFDNEVEKKQKTKVNGEKVMNLG